MEEIWKDIKNFEGKYQVSNLGRVKRLEFVTYTINNRRKIYHNKEKIIKPILDNRNKRYYTVQLIYKQDKKSYRRCAAIHTLVCETFLGDRPKNYVIDHINRNSFDNRLINLRYVTVSENCNNTDKIIKGLHISNGLKGKETHNKGKKAVKKWRDSTGKIHWKY